VRFGGLARFTVFDPDTSNAATRAFALALTAVGNRVLLASRQSDTVCFRLSAMLSQHGHRRRCATSDRRSTPPRSPSTYRDSRSIN